MHTSGYEHLLEKLQLTGRRYLDGFSSEDFVGLSDAEVKDVREVLVDRARQGDGVALDGLRGLLPGDEYLHLLEELIGAQTVGGLFFAQLATYICEIRRDDDLWLRLIDCLEGNDRAAKRWVLSKLQRLPIPSGVRSRLNAVVKGLIRGERDKAVMIIATGVALGLCGIAPKTPVYEELSKRLQSSDPRDRDQALAELNLPV